MLSKPTAAASASYGPVTQFCSDDADSTDLRFTYLADLPCYFALGGRARSETILVSSKYRIRDRQDWGRSDWRKWRNVLSICLG